MTGRILALLAVLALALVVPAVVLAQAPPPKAAPPATVKTGWTGPSQYLVDDKGKTLYLFTRDNQKTSLSACTSAACLARWSPIATSGKPAAG